MSKASLCSIHECGKNHYVKGFCCAHYTRLLRHSDPLGGGKSPGELQHFYEEVVLNYTADECLIWPYTRNKDGYGQMWHDRKLAYVHRLACEDANGAPPTTKHEAAHSCGKGHLGCVTKGHLVWKTSKENKADKLIHGTHNRGERCGTAKITEAQALEILALKGKESRKSIADRFGIGFQQVGKIHRGENWAWIQEFGQ